MSYQTTRQLLEQAKHFHRQLRDVYSAAAASASSANTKSLLEYMSWHEGDAEQCLQDYETRSPAKILDTWFQFTPGMRRMASAEDVLMLQGMSVEDVADVASEVDERLQRFLRGISDLAPSTEVRDVFANLSRLQEDRQRKATRVVLELTVGE